MREDDRVFLLGEDIGVFGGAFGVTTGLLDEFGEARVMDTPIAEEGFVGAAIGAAWMGERPVVELQFADFITCAFDPIVTVAAKTHWRSGQSIPDHDPLPDGRRRAWRAVPRRLPRGLVRRHGRPQDRLPRHRRGRVRASPGGDRRPRPGPLLRAQAALPHAACRGAAERASHARSGLRRSRGREPMRRSSRTAPASRRRSRRPSRSTATSRSSTSARSGRSTRRRSSHRSRRPPACSCSRRPPARPVPPE